MIKFKIDNIAVEGREGETIMEVARRYSIDIMGLCYCPDLKPESSCRLCLISIIGKPGFFTSCNTEIENGMEVITSSPELNRIIKTNFDLIFSKHSKNCISCRRKNFCHFIEIAKKHKIVLRDKPNNSCFKKHQFGPSIIFDPNKCVNCYNCIQVCNSQGVGFLGTDKDCGFSRVIPLNHEGKDCIYCGQCLSHCPGGAFCEVDSIAKVEKILGDSNNYVIFQFSSVFIKSIKNELGSDWDIPYLSRALKKLGAKMVFDTSFGVDVLIKRDSKELMERLKSDSKCLFTSHCPAWVRYIELYRPEFIDNFSSSKSPHMIWAGLVKNYLIREEKIDPKKLFVFSIAPCTAKKYEVLKPDLKVDGNFLVDGILTTSEMCSLFKKNRKLFIDLKNNSNDNVFMKNVNCYDNNEDMMLSGLHYFYVQATGKTNIDIEFKKIIGIDNGFETSIRIGEREINIAVAYGLPAGIKILDELQKNQKRYDYFEVMACPRGCLGGGGQPINKKKKIEKEENGNYNNALVEKVMKESNDDIEKICGIYCGYAKNIKIT